MKVEKSYYRTRTVHRTLPGNTEDPSNSILSCGFLHRPNGPHENKNILFSYYGGLYVISGSGVYIDGETGKEYPVTPGCVVQRMPGKRHHSLIHRGEDWLEFYFCASARVFETLVELGLATDAPVFFVGESMDIFCRLVAYLQLFEQTDNSRSPELLIEFQRLLCHLNSYSLASDADRWKQRVSEVLERNLRVGLPLSEIAKQCGMGYEALRKQFRRVFGCSLEQYRIQLRTNAAKSMILDRDLPLKEIADELGYCDTYAFCKQFKRQVGVSPGKFKSDRTER
ncbi:MAG: AraC family transcriptional regulator [Clostridia bacterium]|nr:AraC family transcriptional regulator [Clostridia bacterium]